MKFYTDSTYFFELWRAEMEKDTENQRQIVKQKGQRKVGILSMRFICADAPLYMRLDKFVLHIQ